MGFLSKQRLKKIFQFFSSIIQKIEVNKSGVFLWIIAFFSITFLRDFLENFIEQPDHIIDLNVHVEFTLFWVSLFLTLVIFLSFVSGQPVVKVSKLVIFGWLVTFIAPIIDLFYYYGRTFAMSYVKFNGLGNYFSFYSYNPSGFEATMGIRIEILVVLIFSGLYVLSRSKSWIRGIFASIGVYTIIFFYMAFPVFFRLGKKIFNITYKLNYPNDFSVAFIVILAILIPFYLYLCRKKKFLWLDVLKSSLTNFCRFRITKKDLLVLVNNIRPERMIHYMLLAILGIFTGLHYKGAIFTQVNVFNAALLLASIFFAWLYAVGVNDIYDVKIDKISNKTRPLSSGQISAGVYSVYIFIFFSLSLILASLVSFASISLIFYFLVAYSFIYSAPPFRFRKYLFIPNILIGLCSLLAFLFGASVVGMETFTLIPKNIAFLVFGAFTLASPLKDLKDWRGDLQEGIVTLPTLFGLKKAKILVGILIASVFLVLPIFIQNVYLWICAIVSAVIALFLVVKKNEKYVFGLWFIFALVFFYLILFRV